MPTSEVQHFLVPIKPGSSNNPAGEARNAWFVIRGKRVIMTGENGNPFLHAGKTFEARLKRGDNPRDVALKMALQIRREFGTLAKADPFNAPIVFPATSLA